jgi:cytochrome c-type biogenesis protein CcmH
LVVSFPFLPELALRRGNLTDMPSTLLFILLAIALLGVALAFILPALLRSRARRNDASREALNADIYRRSLEELNEDAARGDLPPGELQSAREELHRRLVEDSRSTPDVAAPSRTRLAALVVAVALPAVAIGLYFVVGTPQALQESEAPELVDPSGQGDYVARLQSHLARQPRDARGWVLLARVQADQNDFKAAAASFEKAFAVPGKVAKDPGVLCEYADVLGVVQGGRLDGKPMELVSQALAIDPKHPVALEMAGSAAYADGRYGESVRYWRLLLDELRPGTEQHQQLSAAIERAQRRAAVSLPPAPRQ